MREGKGEVEKRGNVVERKERPGWGRKATRVETEAVQGMEIRKKAPTVELN